METRSSSGEGAAICMSPVWECVTHCAPLPVADILDVHPLRSILVHALIREIEEDYPKFLKRRYDSCLRLEEWISFGQVVDWNVSFMSRSRLFWGFIEVPLFLATLRFSSKLYFENRFRTGSARYAQKCCFYISEMTHFDWIQCVSWLMISQHC